MTQDELEIRELVETWLGATEAGEDNTVLDLMSEDVVFLAAGQPVMQGKRAFAIVQVAMKEHTLETKCEIQEIKISGNLAYCWNYISIYVTPKSGGNSVKRAGNALSILEKQNNKWVITRDANMLTVIE